LSPSSNIRTNSLVVPGVLTAAVYLLICLFYVKGPQAHSRTARELFAWFFCSASLILYWKGYQRISRSDKPPVRAIVIFGGLFCLLAFLTVPFHSTDVFGYINRGWQQVHYGQNPYVHPLSEVPNWRTDPMMREHWIYNPNPYGFMFTLLARFLVWLSRGNWWAALALFKATSVIAYAAIASILWSASKRLPYVKAERVLFIWLWSPLILLHHIANGHNDLLVGLMAACAAYFAVTEKYFWIIPALAAATLLKFGPVLLIPLAFIFVIKKAGWKVALLSCLFAGALGVVVSFPYLRDWQLLKLEDMQGNATLIDNSLHSFLIHIFENIARLFSGLASFHPTVNSAIKMILRGGLILFVLYQWLKIPQNFTAKLFNKKSLTILFVLICVASSKFNAWYMGMLLPLALLLEEDYWLNRLVVLISCTELLSLTFFKQAYILNYFALILVPMWLIFRERNTLTQLAESKVETENVGLHEGKQTV
jgi:hypothetical protein